MGDKGIVGTIEPWPTIIMVASLWILSARFVRQHHNLIQPTMLATRPSGLSAQTVTLLSDRSSMYFCCIHNLTIDGRRMVQSLPGPPFSLLYMQKVPNEVRRGGRPRIWFKSIKDKLMMSRDPDTPRSETPKWEVSTE
ncbi:hypothetical protein LX36DRAFT_30668 [Colletotrichum falcatum]|nr:hypothetical protein LX36DRAFT_30668 [Colletotrichum falcatum]